VRTSPRLCARETAWARLFDVELGEDVLEVRFNGVERDGKKPSDLLIGSALGDQIEDLALADAERFRNCTRLDLRLIVGTTTLDEAIEVRHSVESPARAALSRNSRVPISGP